jgi:hypothetical protein
VSGRRGVPHRPGPRMARPVDLRPRALEAAQLPLFGRAEAIAAEPVDDGWMWMLTVQQPWAHAIIHGCADGDFKDVENRTFEPQGPVEWFAILAGLQYDETAPARIGAPRSAVTFGAVIGAVRYLGVDGDSPSRWARPGQKHWRWGDRVVLDPPLRWTGFQGIRPAPKVIEIALLNAGVVRG